MNKLYRMNRLHTPLLVIALLLLLFNAASAAPWSFGVMGDTQWKQDLDGKNPGTVAAGIIEQVNKEFIDKGVRFVIQVGDLSDDGSPNGLRVRNEAAQPLYDAGIGFFPIRGNHDGKQQTALEFPGVYPQTRGLGPNLFGARNFTSPFPVLDGLSYSFDYRNARMVLLDQFVRPDGNFNVDNNAVDQLPWVHESFVNRPAIMHGFFFCHKVLICGRSADTLFGPNPAANQEAQDYFIGILKDARVRYVIGGHDHMYHRSLVKSPDGSSQVQEIICASNSNKFYPPADPSYDEVYNSPPRETPISQELFRVGYYIFTIDGPRLTVDYYSADPHLPETGSLTLTPTLVFSKRETFGYSLNGKEFLVPQDSSYSVVEDLFNGTEAKILSGTNTSSTTTLDGRPLTKAVNTGWVTRTKNSFRSNILTLWGMAAALGSNTTDEYVLSLSFSPNAVDKLSELALASPDAAGNWVNSVELNTGGAARFVEGPWKPEYNLGTYGVDPTSRTAWAVINHGGDFAVINVKGAAGSRAAN